MQATKKTNSTTPSKNEISEPWSGARFVVELASKFGVTGAVVLCILITFLVWGTVEQKRYFIDKFILLKTMPGWNGYLVFIIAVVILAFVGQRIYFRNQVKLKDTRIRELERHSNILENKFLKK